MDAMIQAVLQATLVSKFVLALLLIMSIASWAYMRQVAGIARAAQGQRKGCRPLTMPGNYALRCP